MPSHVKLSTAGAAIFSTAKQIGRHGLNVTKYDWGEMGNSVAIGAFVDLAGGPLGAAAIVTTASLTNRMIDPDNHNKLGTLNDFATGGGIVDFCGHTLGLTNSAFGGTADWYRGNVSYSGGFMNFVDGGGAFGGHAIFVQDRQDEGMIAHEIRHVQQMEKRGNRAMYMKEYVKENRGISYDAPGYENNEYEIDARYSQFLKNTNRIDVYGNKKGNWSNKSVAAEFRIWLYQNYPYNSFKPGGDNDDWEWGESFQHGEDYTHSFFGARVK